MASTVQEKPVQNEPASDATAPGILLLPSHLFFVRTLTLPAGIKPDEIPSFVEVSLEEMSPFTLPQLFYGYYLPADSSRVLVFAAYRRKLEVYLGDAWDEADLVIPDLAALVGMSPEGPTLVFLENELEATAAYWENGGAVPDRVASRLLPEAEEGDPRHSVREELKARIGKIASNARTIVFHGPPRARFRDRNLVFDLSREGGTGSLAVEIPRARVWAMDVRDKEFLEETRKIRKQNRWLWQTCLALVAGFLALAIFEVALFAGAKIIESRKAQSAALAPEVARIMEEQALALRLEELQENRLLPFEMLAYVNRLRPASVYFTRVVTTGVRSVEAEALTPTQADVDRFERALRAAPGTESVEIRNLRVRDGSSSFTVALTVTPEALRELTASPAESETGAPELPLPRRRSNASGTPAPEPALENTSPSDDVPTLPIEEEASQ